METHQEGGGGGGDEQQICRRNSVKFGKCKNVSGDNKLQYCDFHHIILRDCVTNGITPNEIEPLTKKKKKKNEEEKKNLPPYEQRCSHRSNNGTWRCKNLRMGHDAAADDHSIPKTRYCEKHYNYYSNYHKKEKRSGDCAGSSAAIGIEPLQFSAQNPPDERCSKNNGRWRCSNLRMGHGDANSSVRKTRYCQKHYNNRVSYLLLNKKSGDCEAAGPTEETRDSNCSKRRKKLKEEDDCSLDLARGSRQPTTGGSANIGRKTEIVKRTEGSGDLETLARIREPAIELEHYKNKCFELSVELEKKKLGCNRKTTAKVQPQEWINLESQILRVENENSTNRYGISNLECLVPRNDKQSSKLRCVGLPNFEEIESVAWGLQNEVTQGGEKHNTSKSNAETSSGGRKDTHVFELKTEENVLNVQGIGINKHNESESGFHNYSAVEIHSGSLYLSSEGEKVEEGEGCVCSEERDQHGSSSQNHMKMSTKAFVNLVSDDDSDESVLTNLKIFDSSASLGTRMDMMMGMKYRNRNEGKETKWKFEADMLCSLEEEPDLCMKAICALYQQHIFKDEMSANGLFHYSDARRATTLAKFLMDGACSGDLKKSLEDLEKFDSRGVEDCKRLVRSYSKQLFSIYKDRKDPNFLPATTAGHGDQAAK